VKMVITEEPGVQESRNEEFCSENPHLGDLYRETFAARRDNVSRIWNTLTFVTTVFSALLSGVVALTLGYFQFQRSLKEAQVESQVQLLIFGIAFCALIISSLSFFNFRREYERIVEATAIIKKIEHIWGLYRPITDVSLKYFKKDEHVTLERYLEDDRKLFSKVSTDKEWVHLKMGYRRSIRSMLTGADALGTISPFFYVYILISMFSILVLGRMFPQWFVPSVLVILAFLALAFTRVVAERDC